MRRVNSYVEPLPGFGPANIGQISRRNNLVEGVANASGSLQTTLSKLPRQEILGQATLIAPGQSQLDWILGGDSKISHHSGWQRRQIKEVKLKDIIRMRVFVGDRESRHQ